jgi:hypothetical protein
MLSVTDGCQWRCGDGIIVPQRVIDSLVNIAHIPKEVMRYPCELGPRRIQTGTVAPEYGQAPSDR